MPVKVKGDNVRLMVPLQLAEMTEGDNPSSWTQVSMTGEWDHGWYGLFAITVEDHLSMIGNFDASKNKEVMVDYNHCSFSYDKEQAVAAGWAKELKVSAKGHELWALIEWTPAAVQKIKDKEYRYISPELDFNVKAKESDEILGTVLYAIGLVNRPYLEGMAPVELKDGSAVEPFLMAEAMYHKSLRKPGGEPDNQGAIAMNDDRVREILGLKADVDVTDDHRTKALSALEADNKKLRAAAEAAAKNDGDGKANVPDGQVLVDEAEHTELLQLRETHKGAVMLTADEHTQLKADAKAGRDANDKLKLKEREDLVDNAIRARKVLPSERASLIELAETSFELVSKMLSEKPVMKHLKEEETGDSGNSPVDAGKVKKFIDDKAAEHQKEPLKLSAHLALARAQGEARAEFGTETYNAYAYPGQSTE